MRIKGGYRSTHADEVIISDDGVIKPVVATRAGVSQIKYLDPYQVNEAETMAWAGGIDVRPITEKSTMFGDVNMAVTDIKLYFIGLSGWTREKGHRVYHESCQFSENYIKITTDNPNGEY